MQDVNMYGTNLNWIASRDTQGTLTWGICSRKGQVQERTRLHNPAATPAMRIHTDSIQTRHICRRTGNVITQGRPKGTHRASQWNPKEPQGTPREPKGCQNGPRGLDFFGKHPIVRLAWHSQSSTLKNPQFLCIRNTQTC